AHYAANPDWWLSGIHFVDLDDDDNLDLFFSSHGGGDALALLNDGGGDFAVAPGTYPTTEIHLNYDFDEDGKNDLTMTYVDGGAQWWRNASTPGQLDFEATNITRDGNTARTQILADFNRDGRVDWLRTAPPGIEIDFGDGAGGFAQDSYSIVIPGTDSNNNANVIPGDFDNDGDIDLLVMVGGGYDDTAGHTDYYRNEGLVNGVPQYSVQTAAAGLPADGLIVKGVGDYDLDGNLDLIAINNKQLPPVVYKNDGHGVFTLVPDAVSGVVPQNLTYAQWGTAVTADFDNDGIPDILMNGKYYLMLLRGTGGGHFVYMNDAWNIVDTCPCSIDGGLAFGDIDGDGDLDIAGYANLDEPYQVKIYRNDNPAQHWLRVRPVGSHGNRGAAGAKIRLYAAGTQELVGYESVAIYDFQAAPSYYGRSVTERHFGLGARTSVDVAVEFYPSGRIVRRDAVNADSVIEVPEEGDPIFADGFE
ncbi:MAG TPA: CRTAC1 family protein, partial [Pseudomonadales bacterium]|nr:CRTAC1 family protein [Pseudomonadales bacterium]